MSIIYSIYIYIDINECERDKSTCHENAVCFNNEGNFSCQCASGFIGNGYNNCSGTYVRQKCIKIIFSFLFIMSWDSICISN